MCAIVKKRWLAANWSLFFPGLGHLYAGRRITGSVVILVQLLLIGIGIWSAIAPQGSMTVALLCSCIAVIVYLLSLLMSIRTVDGESGSEAGTRRAGRDAWLAVFLTRLLPGIGHFYARQWVRGILFLLCFFLLAAFSTLHPLLTVVVAGLAGFACYDVFRAVAGGRSGALLVVSALVSMGVLAGEGKSWVRDNLIQGYRIPTSSMEPGLRPGDLVLARKLHLDPIERGDVIVFALPKDPSRNSLKRVMGLPGDRVEIRDRNVYINGREVVEAYVKFSGSTIRPEGYRSPNIYPPGAGNADNYGPVVVPGGHYFVLGDHRDNSEDSRYWGFVPRATVRAKVYKIYYPLQRAGAYSSP